MYIVDHGLLDNFQFEGVWWLPQKPDQRFTGILYVRGGQSVELELIGSFQEPKDVNFLTGFSPEIILGVSTENKPCTLVNTHLYSSSPFSSVPVSKFYVSRLYYGALFQAETDIKFERLRLELTYLEPWLGRNPFGIEFTEKGKPVQVSISVPDLPVLETEIGNPSARFSLHSGVGFHQEHSKRITLTQSAWIRIEPPAPQHRRWYEEIARDVENLFTLLMGVPVYPQSLTGFLTATDNSVQSEKPTIQPVEVYFSLLNPKIREGLSPGEMPLPYVVLSDQMPDLIRNWFAKAELLRPVYDLLCGTYYNAGMYEESRFLSLMQALETFHRRGVERGQYWSDEEYSAWSSSVIASLPGQMPCPLKSRLHEYLKHGNEFSLRKRLKLLFKSLDKLQDKITAEVDCFIDLVYNTRNYLTHYDVTNDRVIQTLQEYHEVNRKLSKLLKLLLFRQLGLDVNALGGQILRGS